MNPVIFFQNITFHQSIVNPAYYISEDGQVYSTYRNRILKPNINNGYHQVFLKQPHHKDKWHYVHRLVACQFLSPQRPYHNKLWVNHKDGNKANNHHSNLEWSTISQNIQHSVTTGLRKTPSGKDHWAFGKSPSKETRNRMSVAKKGENHPKFKGYYVTPAGSFSSSTAAALANNTFPQSIHRRCKSWRWKSKGYSFISK